MSKGALQAMLGHETGGTTEIYIKTAAIDTQREFRKAIANKA